MEHRTKPKHSAAKQRSGPPGYKWIQGALRGAHIAAVVGLAGWFAGVPGFAWGPPLVLVSGLLLLALELWAHPGYIWQLTGLHILAKFALLGLALAFEAWRWPVFWAVILLSSLISHAPGWARRQAWRAAGR